MKKDNMSTWLKIREEESREKEEMMLLQEEEEEEEDKDQETMLLNNHKHLKKPQSKQLYNEHIIQVMFVAFILSII